MRKFLRHAMPIVVAVVLGPLMGGIAVCLFAAVLSLVDPARGGSLSDLPGLCVLYILFAYLLGWPIALLTGVLVSIATAFRPPNLVIVVAAALVAVGLMWLAAAAGLLGPVPNVAFGFLAPTVGVSAFAAIACWLSLRPLAARINP